MPKPKETDYRPMLWGQDQNNHREGKNVEETHTQSLPKKVNKQFVTRTSFHTSSNLRSDRLGKFWDAIDEPSDILAVE